VFSHGGQHFAAVNGTLLQVYNTYTCDCIATLRGHSGKVSSILWTRDDRRLLSAGKDGAVYEWRMRDFKREKEHVLKGCQYTSVAQTADNITLLAAGSDCIIKELEEHASAGTQVKQEVETGVVLTSIHLTKVISRHISSVLTAAATAISCCGFHGLQIVLDEGLCVHFRSLLVHPCLLWECVMLKSLLIPYLTVDEASRSFANLSIVLCCLTICGASIATEHCNLLRHPDMLFCTMSDTERTLY
jgi:hypothetical protein